MERIKRTGADPIDAHVGERIKARRQAVNVSQEALGGAVGVSFQQMQKYESGANRVSASRLARIAAYLKIAPGWFFDGAPEVEQQLDTALPVDPFKDNEVVAVASAFHRIKDPELRKHIVGVIEAVRVAA